MEQIRKVETAILTQTQENYERALYVIYEMRRQIMWSIDKWTFFSWGVKASQGILFHGMITFALNVNGAIHEGWVFISLNEGKDVYEVRLMNENFTQKGEMHECYCDNLGSTIDRMVDRPEEIVYQ